MTLMAKKYTYQGQNILEILGKKSEKEKTDAVNHCLIAGRKNVLSIVDDRYQAKIRHFNKVVKALPDIKLAEYIRVFLNTQ